MPHTHEALALALSALQLISAPERPDGTYNRGRRACEELARETIRKIEALSRPSGGTTAPAQPASVVEALARDPGPFVVYTDGACKGNPGPAGWGIVVLAGGKVVREDGGFIGKQTNQIAELVAAIEGLRRTPVGAPVELVSDSQYTLKCLTEWRRGWERNGFRTAQKEPVKNLDYVKQLYAVADERKVTTRWVRGHSGDPYNERCDTLANDAIAAVRR